MPTQPLAEISQLPGIPDAVAQARAAIDALRRHRVVSRYAERVGAESALRGARATAALEGADLPLHVVRVAVADGQPLPAAVAPTVEGALRAVAASEALRTMWQRAPLQVLARLHAVSAAGLAGAEQLGRPRADPAVAARLRTVVALLTSRSDAPAAVLAAVVHGELVAARPFPTASGIVARTAERLTLITGGLDPHAVSAPEVGHAELGRIAYDEAAAGYAAGGVEGVGAWVRHCAEATVLGARDMLAYCQALERTG